MPEDQPMLTVSLSPQDWQVIMRGVYKLPMEEAVLTANRLQTALAEAQKPPEVPHIVRGGKADG